jgi:3-hydroxybutyryl-CoA dehydrogenase
MKIIIIANAEQEQEIMQKATNEQVELIINNEFPATGELQNAEAIFILNQNISSINFNNLSGKPIFINSVIDTLSELKLPKNVSRINGWPGFLQRETWEIASENKNESTTVFERLGWKIIFVKDEPGLVAARIISRIINEAFFAFEEKVSSIEEIDQAMKLGTNYPFGPFEWAEKIGVKNLVTLLNKLSEKDKSYQPSDAFLNLLEPNN